jgi:hypothetical protein
VCRAEQCIGPDPESLDSPNLLGNCGLVTSDVHMLVRHVHIFLRIYVLYIYLFESSTKKVI